MTTDIHCSSGGLTRDDVAFVFYGVPLVDIEDGVIALSHDRRRVIAALNRLHREIKHSSLAEHSPTSTLGEALWVRLERRSDGPWYPATTRHDPHALPATYYDD